MSERLIVFDTTLRDGEQSPGASMTKEEKLRIARQLERLKVDVIEAGFPASSPGDFEAVHTIAASIRNSVVCALTRTREADILQAAEAIRPAARGRIHVFIATSPVHMRMKLGMQPEQVLEQAVQAVRLARRSTDDVEFSAEDAGRSEFGFLCRVLEAVMAAGATTLNVPDTVGYNFPAPWGELFRRLREAVPSADRVIWSTHCHNDLGLAVANSLAAVANGARQVECTVNGIGERAGNAALEEIVMALHTRADLLPVATGIELAQIVPTSRLVSQVTGYPVQPNKAVVGANAFVHESGIHQDGVIKHRETYEIMRAEDVGWQSSRLTLGKLSGRSAFARRLAELGIVLPDERSLSSAFARFKELADKKREIFDEDLQAIVGDEPMTTERERYRLVAMRVETETGEVPRAAVTLAVDGIERKHNVTGSGPVDAAFKAIESLVGSGSELLLYSVSAITTGTDALGEVTVRLARDKRVVNGQGADTDIIVASAKAYLNALNKLACDVRRQNPQHASV